LSLHRARFPRARRRGHRLAPARDGEASDTALVADLFAPAHRRAALTYRRLRRTGGDGVRLVCTARLLFGAGAKPVAALVAGGKSRHRRGRDTLALLPRRAR